MTVADPRRLAAELRRLQPRKYLEAFLEQNIRHDGRAFAESRPVSVTSGSITCAHGSALVRQGETMILCGVTAQIAEPDLLCPNVGFIVPNVELPALASSNFRTGPPSDEAQVLSDRLRQIILASSMIHLSSLCIKPGKAVWVLNIDAVCLNHAGNLFDAIVLAATAALRNTRLLQAEWDEDEEEAYEIDGDSRPLKLSNLLFSTTCASLSGKTIVDLDAFEDAFPQSTATVILDEKGQIRHLTQTGSSGTDNAETSLITTCMQMARDRLPALLQSLH